MKGLVWLIVLLIPSQAFAVGTDDLEEMYVTRAKAFVKENPLIENKVDEMGLVDLWQRIQGVHNLINIWDSNQAAFNRSESGELRSWYLYKRIWSHRSNALLFSDDSQVQALSALIRLHGSFADRYMDGGIKYAVYAELADYAESYGRDLAVKIEKKYGNGKKIVKPLPSLSW